MLNVFKLTGVGNEYNQSIRLALVVIFLTLACIITIEY